MTAPDVVGAWSLLRFTLTLDDGRVFFPLGERARGQIVYTRSGHMSAVLAKEDRAPLSCTRLEDARNASDEEKARSFDSYVSYAGHYRFEGDEVIHTVTHALVENIVGNEQRRRFRVLEDGALELSYEVVSERGRARYALTWERGKTPA